MRKFAEIIESTTVAPPTNCLWIKGNDALYFTNGKWVSLFKKEDFINITDRFNKHSISLIEAIQIVPTHQRIDGLVITFEDINGDWRIYQFRGDAVDFFDENKWTDLYDYTNYIVKSITPDEEDLTVSKPDKNGNAIVSLKDRVYDESNFSGKGYKILRKNIQIIDGVRKNILTQDMINKPNTIYEIRYDFDLKEQEIIIPEGCVLKFKGGSFRNGVLKGNNTKILAGYYDYIFKLDVIFGGEFDIEKTSVCWFGATQSTLNGLKVDSSDAIQHALDIDTKCGFNIIYIPRGLWYVSKTINISHVKILELEGKSTNIKLLNFSNFNTQFITCGILYTDKDINLINIDIKDKADSNIDPFYSVYINGGQIDVSLVDVYTKNLITISDKVNKTQIWGFYLDTSLISSTKSRTNLAGVAILIDLHNGGYATSLYIKGVIFDFGYGIKDSISGASWITELIESSNMRCGICHYLTSLHSIRLQGVYQASNVYNNNEEGHPVTYINKGNVVISGAYWDLYMPVGDKHTTKIGVEIGPNTSVFDIYFDGLAKKLITEGLVKNLNKALYYDDAFYKFMRVDNRKIIGYSELDNFLIDDESFTITSNISEGIRVNDNINNLFKTKSNGISYSFTTNNFEDQYIEVTLEFDVLAYFNIVGCVLSAINRFVPTFKKFKVTLIDSKGSEHTKEISTDSNFFNTAETWYVFPDYIGTKKLKLKWYEGVPATYGDAKTGSIYSVFARSAAVVNYNKYITSDGYGLKFIKHTGSNEKVFLVEDSFGTNRPNLKSLRIGCKYFDYNLGKPIFKKNDTTWVDTNGILADVLRAGNFSQKPNAVPVGFAYFCTDKQTTEGSTNGIMIYHKGNNVWVDALGRVIS